MESKYLELLRREVVPALGCTEPIAVALSVVRAREALDEPAGEYRVRVRVSANVYKNGLGVGIPGTGGGRGLKIASALGLVCGCSSDGLEVLRGVTPSDVARAEELVARGSVEVGLARDVPRLHISASVRSERTGSVGEAVIEHAHANIVRVSRDGQVLYSQDEAQGDGEAGVDSWAELARSLTFEGIYDFASRVPVERLELLRECARLNRAISDEGGHQRYGLGVGYELLNGKGGLVGSPDGMMLRAMGMAASACDARMAGVQMPVMSNSGSGNQGLTATLPVLACADALGASEEACLRALAVSHLVAIHLKGYLGRLSPLCGCVLASAGAGCAIAYLKGGDAATLRRTVQNMLGDLAGMICDGAKSGCALKVSSGVCSAIRSAQLALSGVCIGETDGLIAADVEESIATVARLGSEGMPGTDEFILGVMLAKSDAGAQP